MTYEYSENIRIFVRPAACAGKLWNEMKKIMFLCHGNICRSPMAEYIMKDLVRRAGVDSMFRIGSAAVSSEETGNPIYPHALKKLKEKGIPAGDHRAHRITREEFDGYDLIVVMDRSNLSYLARIVGQDAVSGSGKVHMLMEYAGDGKSACPDVADPWYTRDFERSYEDILAGCRGLLSRFGRQVSV